MKLLATALIATLSASCSVVFQDGVRSSGYNCSTSYGWAASDVVLSAANIFVASRGGADNPPYVLPAEIIAGTFIASAAIGAYKAHHCANYLEDPAVIAQINADRERMAEAEARGRAEAEAAAAARAAACAAQGGCDDSVPAPDDNATADNTEQACPDGQQLGGQFWDTCFTCPEGASIGGFANRECICPEGTSSNGTACVAPSGDAAPPAPKHHHSRPPVAQPQVHVDVEVHHPAPPPLPPNVYRTNAVVSAVLGNNIKNCRTLDSMAACQQFCSSQKLPCACVSGGC